MSYVIKGVPTLPCSVVGEENSWKGDFSVLKNYIHGMESRFCFLPSQKFLSVTKKVILSWGLCENVGYLICTIYRKSIDHVIYQKVSEAMVDLVGVIGER